MVEPSEKVASHEPIGPEAGSLPPFKREPEHLLA